jgi:predicted dehydrogenase
MRNQGRRLPVDAKIIIIGLGIAGSDHAKALEQLPGADVVAVVDPDLSRTLTFRGRKVPTYRTVLDARSRHDPDVLVIASPTSTHARVCDEITEHFPAAEVLVEKPAAADLADARRVITGKLAVSVAFHMAYSPEVEWALNVASERVADLGPPVAIMSASADPYQGDLASARKRLGNSWIDTGINALSVIDRFAIPLRRQSLRRLGEESWSAYEGIFTCAAEGQTLTAVVLTSWYSTDRSRTTRIKYASGAELVMDHNAVSGYLLQDSAIASFFGSDGSVPRRENHYRALYASWLAERETVFPRAAAMRLHQLLLEP